jgi:hypothetical protein
MMLNSKSPHASNFSKKFGLFVVISLIMSMLTFLGAATVFGQSTTVTSLNFGTITFGTSAPPQNVTFTNNSTGNSIIVVGFPISAGYTVSSTCPTAPAALAPGASCSFTVTFVPPAPGTYNGSLDIQYQLVFAGSPTGTTLTSSVGLFAIAQAPTPTPSPTATATATATVTPTGTPLTGSAIGGTIRLDGKPLGTNALRTNQTTPSFQVRLDPTGTLVSPNQQGYYLFGGLQAGKYVVRVLYDPTKVQPVNGRDFSEQTVTGTSVERAIDFDFVSIQQQVPPTPTFTPQPPPVTTQPPSGGASTPTPTNTVPSRPQPQCPPQIDGNNLQVAMQITPVDANFSYLCVRVTQGRNLSFNADLSNTVEINAPANILENIPSTGRATVNANTAIWSVGVLAPGQTATFIVGIGTSAANLSSTVTTVTGVFGTGEAFRRVINGIIPLTEIVPSAPATNRPGGNTTVPVRLPSTGSGNPDTPLWWSITVLITLVITASTSYLIARRQLKKKPK